MGSQTPTPNEEVITGNLGIKDISYVSSVIQVLYNLSEFKEYFFQNLYEKNQNKHLSILMHKILKTKLFEINFDEEAINILSCLRINYGLNRGNTPGEILIQILLVLKYEEKEISTEQWEKVVYKNQELFSNITNEQKALNDLLDKNMEHFNTNFSNMFFGVFLAKRKFLDLNNILFFYNFYCVYELNMPRIYHNLINKRKLINNRDQLPKINLIDCIKEMQETHIEIFNKQKCYIEYYMFNAPDFLIFLLKLDDPKFDNYRGNILFDEIIDFSPVIKNTQSNRFKLVSVINQKKYIVKKREKDDKGVSWFNNDNESDKDDKEYKSIFRDEKGNFCFYKKDNDIKHCQLLVEDYDYFHHILIFKRCES